MALPLAALLRGERRLEAENYLSSGYGHWLAMDARLGGTGRIGDVARVWQPARLKGITVDRQFGVPFLAATQAFDMRPIARKFLSLDRTEDAADRFAGNGSILVTCSGSVGRATLATSALDGVLLSHDLLRVEATAGSQWGWVYAYLRSAKVRAMMSSARYGHIIKHLEPSHLSAVPMPRPRDDIAAKYQAAAHAILAARNEAVRLTAQAEALFEAEVGPPGAQDFGEQGYVFNSASMGRGRRRLEAVFHNPAVRALQAHFRGRGFSVDSLGDIGFDIWLPTRFRRLPAEEGVTLVGSADLFEINPDLPKRIADIDFGDRNKGRVQRGWLLLARSGQTYGINGTLAIANAFHEGKVISDHVIRIAPRKECTARPGYIYTALSNPTLGRPLVKALAYGSSIPEIDVTDVERLQVVRLDERVEHDIADMTEEAARLFASADIMESQMGAEVDDLVSRLIAGDWASFVRFKAGVEPPP